ncbi:hypothetical protein N7539_009121 [Penicillium diatomitis]|uniref:Uncharacterized protein n=1 Tax=Penicillium diatomitis TaxID=2819901 RepID=A0A9W9WLU6_9EURO|nr:uncharacterized protein N7539_009121 [Penicillium diatomitis]KAJ5469503.1 hypothetical protein N7539_009121 [Penicillium diatomitis]
MSAFNPFRAKNAVGSADSATGQLHIAGKEVQPGEFFKPVPQPQLPRHHPHSPPGIQTANPDASAPYVVNTVNPFAPEFSANDHERNTVEQTSPVATASQSSSDDGGQSVWPSDTEKSQSAAQKTSLGTETGNTPSSDTLREDGPVSMRPGVGNPQVPRSRLEAGANTSPSGRSTKDKKPPPPPPNHHGRKISTPLETAGAISQSSAASPQPSPPRSRNRLSYHALLPDYQTSRAQRSDTSRSRLSSDGVDYFSSSTSLPVPQPAQAAENGPPLNPVQRSGSQRSQRKRPPTPPLSRRQSQMGRSRSSQSKASGGRLVMSSLDSEGTDGSRPPSPGPSARSTTPTASEYKRFSMPPSAAPRVAEREADSRPSGSPLPRDTLSSAPATARANLSSHGRRASSYNVPMSSSSSSSSVPPLHHHHLGGRETQALKEVDDLRGHYENRQVSS